MGPLSLYPSWGLCRTLEEEGCAHLGCVAMTLVSMVLGTNPPFTQEEELEVTGAEAA